MAIDLKQMVQTHDGRQIKGVFADGSTIYGFAEQAGKWFFCSWNASTGKLLPDSAVAASTPDWDIENTPEKFALYVNVYRKGGTKLFFGGPVDSAVAADAQAGGQTRVARLFLEFADGRLDP